jgi:two-component system phosphate regulon sensor histidine kinase PhoR
MILDDENKRMHAQVENVYEFLNSRKELDIEKESSNVEEVIIDAIEHVNLILEDREGQITTQLREHSFDE